MHTLDKYKNARQIYNANLQFNLFKYKVQSVQKLVRYHLFKNSADELQSYPFLNEDLTSVQLGFQKEMIIV